MKTSEVIDARGHENIQSIHKTTFEITRETTLTKRGDCVIAVGATKGAADLSPKFKDAARREGAQITIMIEAEGVREIVKAWGSPRLLFTHPTDLVVRRSDHVCGRTIAIRADKSANDLSRRLVETLRDPHQKVRIVLIVEELPKLGVHSHLPSQGRGRPNNSR
ncbi:MAG: hypothetical protein AOA65_2409 [Candidatus Bathyarchaeota archaeon BA1]|nr:MAG: hypothetical protein AOA65_2409 [Candidatus Bathyarchaeota archaeon BA1]